jgi:hypothetical protein
MRESERARKRERARERERVCVCVCEQETTPRPTCRGRADRASDSRMGLRSSDVMEGSLLDRGPGVE